jgi:mRNA interferase MazF
VKRGEVYLASLDPTRGSQQAGIRPVVIFQNSRLVAAGNTVVVIPFTTNAKYRGLPSCVFVPAGEGGLTHDSVLLCHQIRALDKAGIMGYWGTLSPQILAEVDEVVLYTLGITVQ